MQQWLLLLLNSFEETVAVSFMLLHAAVCPALGVQQPFTSVKAASLSCQETDCSWIAHMVMKSTLARWPGRVCCLHHVHLGLMRSTSVSANIAMA